MEQHHAVIDSLVVFGCVRVQYVQLAVQVVEVLPPGQLGI